MKKTFAVIIALFALVCFTGVALATEVELDKTVNQIVFKKDKNGNEYARIIVSDKRELNGVTYNKDVSVMAFGPMVPKVKSLKKGSHLKGIATVNEFRGGTSYQLLELIQ